MLLQHRANDGQLGVSGQMEIRQATDDSASTDATGHTLTPGVLAAIAVAACLILVALIWMIVLLVRARRAHSRLIADLEHRGISVTKIGVQEHDGQGSVKQRTVLRRKSLIPYTRSPGWGTLPSSSSLGQHSQLSRDLDIPPLPTLRPNDVPNKRTWSFSRRSPAPSNIRLNKVRNARLSAIIESPRTIIGSPTLSAKRKTMSRSASSEQDTPTQRSRKLSPNGEKPTIPSDAPKVPKPPPLFSRNKKNCMSSHSGRSSMEQNKPTSAPEQIAPLEPLPLFSDTDGSLGITLTPKKKRRSNSVPSVVLKETSQKPASGLAQTRLPSFHNRQSGLAPQLPVPPLPLRAGHWRSRSYTENNSPSRRSDSSFESATSSILITGTSPHANRSPNARLKHGANHELKNALIHGPRPIRPIGYPNSLTSYGTSHGRQESIRSNVAIYTIESNPPSRTGSMVSLEKRLNVANQRFTDTGRVGRPPERTPSTRKHNDSITPSRRSQVNPHGSPEDRSERKTQAVLRDVSANVTNPARQPSQMSLQPSSSTSSMGNPFQWDHSPTKGRSASFRGSPVRRAHRRQNCIRMSSTGPSPSQERNSFMFNIQEEPSDAASRAASNSSVGKSTGRPLPRPPSSSTFAPDVRLSPKSFHTAPMAPGSPTHSDGDKPQWRTAACLSDGSIFNIPTFPSPVRDEQKAQSKESSSPASSPYPIWNVGKYTPKNGEVTSGGSASAFKGSGPRKSPDTSGYDPNFPIMEYYVLNPSPTRPRPDSPVDPLAALAMSSRKAPTSSTNQAQPKEKEKQKAAAQPQTSTFSSSPSVSPKTVRHLSMYSIPPISPSFGSPSSRNADAAASIHNTPIPSRTSTGSPSPAPRRNQKSNTNSPDPQSTTTTTNTNTNIHPALRPLSTASSAFTTTQPAIMGPRTEPARDLRKTVAALRRMNSAAKASDNRPTRRYLQLGREATSSNLPAAVGGGISKDDSFWSLPGLSPQVSPRRSDGRRDGGGGGGERERPGTSAGNGNGGSSVPTLTAASASAPSTSTTTTTTTAPPIGLGLNLTTAPSPSSTYNYAYTYAPHPSSTNQPLPPPQPPFAVGTGSARSASVSFSGSIGSTLQPTISLTNLVLSEDDDIFGRGELEAANPSLGTRSGGMWGGSANGSARRSSVWEDGEGFWSNPFSGVGSGVGVGVGSGFDYGSNANANANSGSGSGPSSAAPRTETSPDTTWAQTRQLFSMDGDSDVENWLPGSGSGPTTASTGAGTGFSTPVKKDKDKTNTKSKAKSKDKDKDKDKRGKDKNKDKDKRRERGMTVVGEQQKNRERERARAERESTPGSLYDGEGFLKV